jgi:uncharacterized protein YutE (UPF0331/DUF86 family)
MTPVEIETIRQKLGRILEDLKLLEPIARLSYGQYMEQVYQRKAAERLLQTIIEAAIDVNNHLLVGSGYPPARDYQQSFLDVADKMDVLERDLAMALAPSAGLRNRLVHEYDRVDDAIVFASIGETLRHYPRYAQAVLEYLERRES